MTDLRTRIAAVLWDTETTCSCDRCVDCCEQVADAVIRELGLKRESMLDGIAPVDDPPAFHYRYVTEWTTDE